MMHQIFDRFWHRFFIDCWSIWEANLGPCWPHFPPKWGGAVARRPLFCWVYVIFRFWGPPGPLLAPFGLDFGGFGARFWKFLVPIFSFLINVCEFKFSIKLALCAIIVFLDLDGLVGLREAQRICSLGGGIGRKACKIPQWSNFYDF